MLKKVYAVKKMESKRLPLREWAIWSANAAAWMLFHKNRLQEGVLQDSPFVDCYLADYTESVKAYKKILRYRRNYGTSMICSPGSEMSFLDI